MITSNVSKLVMRRSHASPRVCLRCTCEIVCSIYLWERSVGVLRIGSDLFGCKLIRSAYLLFRLPPIQIVQFRELLFSVVITHSSVDIALILVTNGHCRLQDTKWVLDATNIVESDKLLLTFSSVLPLWNWTADSFFRRIYFDSASSCFGSPVPTLHWCWNCFFSHLLVILFVYLFNLICIWNSISFYLRSNSLLRTEFPRFDYRHCIYVNSTWYNWRFSSCAKHCLALSFLALFDLWQTIVRLSSSSRDRSSVIDNCILPCLCFTGL